MPPPPSKKKKLLIALASFAAAALIGELAVRILIGAPLAERLPILLMQANETRGWEMVPNHVHYTYRYEVRVNSLGLRGPELAEKRSGTIAKATVASDSRQVRAETLDGGGDMAFAATEVRRRDETEVALTRRRPSSPGESDPERNVSSYGASRTTSSLRDQLGERKRRGGLGIFAVAGVVIGAAAWILWPRHPPLPVDANYVATSSSVPVASAATRQVAVKVTFPPTGRSTLSSISPEPEAAHVAPPAAVQVQSQSRIDGKSSSTFAPVTALGPSFSATIV